MRKKVIFANREADAPTCYDKSVFPELLVIKTRKKHWDHSALFVFSYAKRSTFIDNISNCHKLFYETTNISSKTLHDSYR